MLRHISINIGESESAKSLSRVRLCSSMDCSLPGSSVHGISQARILGWVAIPFSRGSSRPRDQIRVSWIAGRFFTIWATREAPIVSKDESIKDSFLWDKLKISCGFLCTFFELLKGNTPLRLSLWTWVWANSGTWWGTGKLACYSPGGCKESKMT